MVPIHNPSMSARERQIMDAVTELGSGTVSEITRLLPDAPTSNAVRTMLGLMLKKGYVKASRRGRAKVYRPADSPARASRRALRELLRVFFGGSMKRAVVSYFSDPRAAYSDEELEQIERVLREIRAERKKRKGDDAQ
jgi:predicted transcriptional regulator